MRYCILLMGIGNWRSLIPVLLLNFPRFNLPWFNAGFSSPRLLSAFFISALLPLTACTDSAVLAIDDAPKPTSIVNPNINVQTSALRLSSFSINDVEGEAQLTVEPGDALTMSISVDARVSGVDDLATPEVRYFWQQQSGVTVTSTSSLTQRVVGIAVPLTAEPSSIIQYRVTAQLDGAEPLTKDFFVTVEGGSLSSVLDVFSDLFLRACVQNALAAVGSEDVSQLTQLDCSTSASKNCSTFANCRIEDLSGIDTLRSLNTVNLANNLIVDVQPLTQLLQLSFADLSANPVNDLQGLNFNGVSVLADLQITGLLPSYSVNEGEALSFQYGLLTPLWNYDDVMQTWSVVEAAGTGLDATVITNFSADGGVSETGVFNPPGVDSDTVVTLELNLDASGVLVSQPINILIRNIF